MLSKYLRVPSIQPEKYALVRNQIQLKKKKKSSESSLKKAPMEILVTVNEGIKRSGNQ